MRIFLIGYMGSGKSSVGAMLARRIHGRYIDTDAVVILNAGKSIPEIFQKDGESVFRRLEQEVLHETAHEQLAIVATGGGLPCHFDNMEWMNRNGVTVYLKASPEELAVRLENDRGNRPLLSNKRGTDLVAAIRNHLAEREPFYQQATLTVSGTLEEMADKISALMLEHGIRISGT